MENQPPCVRSSKSHSTCTDISPWSAPRLSIKIGVSCAGKNEADLQDPIDNIPGHLEIAAEAEPPGTKKNAKGGRPREIELATLYAQRDRLVSLLASSWERMGLQLERFRRARALGLKDLRVAFAPLKDDPRGYLPASLLRETTEPATPKAIRESRATVADLSDRLRKAMTDYQAEHERLRTAKDAYQQLTAKQRVAADQPWRQAVRREKEAVRPAVKQHCIEFRKAKATLDDCKRQLNQAERKLTDQEAHFAQSEVLKFLRCGRNRLNPKRLADAMAGLPRLGCRQSSRLCAKQSCELWPHPHYQMLTIIERIWQGIGPKDRNLAVEIFRNEIILLPKKSPKTNEAYLRHLCQNWRYLRLAIMDCLKQGVSSREMPYQIMSHFSTRLARPRYALESLRAEQEAL